MSTSERLSKARDIAKSAGDIALKYFRQSITIENKLSDGHFDPVTQADKEVESFIRQQLEAHYPQDGILGEEQAEKPGSNNYRWVIDPIDGTRAFMTGMPLWGILMGLQTLQENAAPKTLCLAGLMYQPFTDELFYGEVSDKAKPTQNGATLLVNGHTQNIHTSQVNSLKDANLYTTTKDTFAPHPGALDKFEALEAQVQLSRYGGDCYSYCLLAMGQVDLVIDGSLQPYDIVPLIPIIEAAGGIVSNWQGEDAANGGLIVAAANKELHAQALAYLQEKDKA